MTSGADVSLMRRVSPARIPPISMRRGVGVSITRSSTIVEAMRPTSTRVVGTVIQISGAARIASAGRDRAEPAGEPEAVEDRKCEGHGGEGPAEDPRAGERVAAEQP